MSSPPGVALISKVKKVALIALRNQWVALQNTRADS